MVRSITLSAAILAALAGTASGHVQPSLNENNRYLKLTPLGDRLRLAYTIYFGEVPGAALRRQMDADRDGQISLAEAERLGHEVGATVQAAVSVTVDGVEGRLTWTAVDVGLGTPDTAAGSFAIDLIASVCLVSRGEHEVVVRDDYALPVPGETELKVDAGLGVKVQRVSLGGSALAGDEVRIRGVGGPLAIGWAARLTITDAAPSGGGTCGAAAAAPTGGAEGGKRGWLLAAVAAVIAGLAVGIVIGRRSRRKKPAQKVQA